MPKKISGKFFLFIVPVVIILLSYYLLFIVARGGLIDTSSGSLKLFFDLAYPIGDIVILTIALLVYGLSSRYLGGIFKTPILIIICGFIANYIADFSFSFTTTNGTFFVASWVDLVFLTTMFILSFGVSLFDPALLVDDNK